MGIERYRLEDEREALHRQNDPGREQINAAADW